MLQTFNIDGSAPKDLTRNVRWDLKKVATTASMTVAVGGGATDPAAKSGLVLDSDKRGDTWHEAMVFATSALNDVAVNDKGVFVAVGIAGTVVYSDEAGGRWELAPKNTIRNLVAVTWGGGRFLAVTQDGDSISSVDGRTWSPVQAAGFETPNGVSRTFSGLSFHSGRFVMYGDMYIYPGLPGTRNTLWESSDGKAWTAVNAPPTVWAEASVCGDALYVLGERRIGVSAGRDLAWRFIDMPADFGKARSIACGQGKLAVLASVENPTSGDSKDSVHISLDLGQTWITGVVPLAEHARRIAFARGHWFLAGDQDMLWRAP